MMNKKMKEIKDYYREHYFDEDISSRVKNKVHQNIQKGSPTRRSGRKKVFFLSSAAILMVSLFVGTAFGSSTLANFFSSIPYVNANIEPGGNLAEELDDKLAKHEIQQKFISISSKPNKMVEVGIKSTKKEFNQIKKDIKHMIQQVLNKNQYDSFSIKVLRVDGENEINHWKIDKNKPI